MWYNRLKTKNYFNVLFLLMASLAIVLFIEPAKSHLRQTTGDNVSTKDKITVAIDPGHGGRDPGKVGVTGTLEKDINLQIALKLKAYLEKKDINVVMTRTEDVDLGIDSDSNKKAADMRRRVEAINNSDAIIAVSIHQNSFTQESIKGSQVFYYTQSAEGETFAKVIQSQLKETLKDGNKREAKSNDSYYMLKKTNCPIVIVECGYLSNYSESALLVDEEYQGKVAFAVHLGIMSYINESIKTTSIIAGR